MPDYYKRILVVRPRLEITEGEAAVFVDKRTGPLLSDGTPFESLIDTESREVSLRVLNDPEVYKLEQALIFAKSWIVVGHATEIPEPGRFVTRYIAEDSVIVTRRRDETIDVLLNVCTHRGMQVCRAEAGTAKHFKCPYHGWLFGPDGALKAAPYEREMYSDGLDKQQLGLQKARVEIFCGIIFATWDLEAPTLAEYLGEYAWYLQAMFGRTDDGIEVYGAPQRFTLRANWKTAGEQFAGDGYHAISLHRSLSEMGFRRPGVNGDARDLGQYGIDVSTPQGHGLRCMDRRLQFPQITEELARASGPLDVLSKVPPLGVPLELVNQLPNHLTEDQLRAIVLNPPTAGGLFPNVGIACFASPTPDGPGPSFGLHVFQPKGPDTMEFWHWNFVEKGASEEFKRWSNRATTLGLGSTGMIEVDDAEAWPSMQQSARGYMGRKHSMKYQALLGQNKPKDWGGGGYVYEGYTKDDNQWNWWLRYREFMMGNPWVTAGAP